MLTATSRAVFGLLLAAFLFAGGLSTALADELVITAEVKATLNEYLHKKKPLAFAVSADGTRAGWVYCEGYRCDPTKSYRAQAIGLCVKMGGKDCRILAVGTDVKLDYRVGDGP